MELHVDEIIIILLDVLKQHVRFIIHNFISFCIPDTLSELHSQSE